MPTPHELTEKFWKSLKSDMTVMLGLLTVDDGHTRPMTAQLDGDEGPIWFFTDKNSNIVKNLDQDNRAICTFTSKGNDLFASIHGEIFLEDDPAMIDKLWNSFVAAWYKEGKNDPTLALIRFDPQKAEIWLNGSNLLAGIKILLGRDPQKDYKDNVAKVRLS